MTPEQQRLYNAACGDLGKQLTWDGLRLGKDGFRLLITSAILGQRQVRDPLGNGLIIMGRSSKELSTAQASEAIDLCYAIGDAPWNFELKHRPVKWCDVICLSRGIRKGEQ